MTATGAPRTPAPPPLEVVVARTVARALEALEAEDPAAAEEWLRALFHTDLRGLSR